MRAWLLVICFGLAACKDKKPPAPPPAPPVAAPPVPAPKHVAADDVTSPQARCLYACLLLVDTPIADAPAAYTKTCKKPWPYAPDDCSALRYAAACIDAAHGRVFERREWIDRFTHTAWYKPRPDSTPGALSATATANLAALTSQEAACRAKIPAVTPADRALAKTWFTRLMAPDPKLIEGVFTDPENLHRELAGLTFADDVVIDYEAMPIAGKRTISVEHLRRADGSVDTEHGIKLSFAGEQLTGVGW